MAMVHFFSNSPSHFYALAAEREFTADDLTRIIWLLSGARKIEQATIDGPFVGPRKEMLSPWCSNAMDILRNSGVAGINRIEIFKSSGDGTFDPMLQQPYAMLDQSLFTIEHTPAAIVPISDIGAYNEKEGLALSKEEVSFLEETARRIGRTLTDSEVFGFSQINSEHCRHKIFNGTFFIDDQEQPETLFAWIRKTSQIHPNEIISAYKDNVAFIQGPVVQQFAPVRQDEPAHFAISDFESVLSLKAETHNFPTTVEPFNGAATGSGGEIRDRMAGGQGSIPLAGTAVYMTSYSRLTPDRPWELSPREWLYQSPKELLIKASNGASDYGNKFGQPLICGSVLTFEHQEKDVTMGFDKVIMLAGGIGYARKEQAQKQPVKKNQTIVVMGGDNYRIGMGGGAVSSVDTGAMKESLELNAVQRANPEVQKRVANVIRAMVEAKENPVVSIHDHGAGGHLNCLSELVEETGGRIDLTKLPIGDPTLSEKEILSNESQERMGLVIGKENLDYLKKVSARERAPLFEVGQVTSDQHLEFTNGDQPSPFSLALQDLFGSSPKTVLKDRTIAPDFTAIDLTHQTVDSLLTKVLQLEAVACKDWLTNKVDRCVSGRVATQQTAGPLQLPLNNVGVVALDFVSHVGIATAIGHAPVPGLIHSGAGSRLSVTEALTNLVWAPLSKGLSGVSLSANWMWPANNPGENARLYEGVKSISEFVQALGINIPTGKDSLSMTQKYPDGQKVKAPGTVIVSATAEVNDIRQTVSPVLETKTPDTTLLYIDFSGHDFSLGGSSLAQVLGQIGETCPDAAPEVVMAGFSAVQELVQKGLIVAGHDVSAGGLVTTLLEMNFANVEGGVSIELDDMDGELLPILFAEKPAVVIQGNAQAITPILEKHKASYTVLGKPHKERNLVIHHHDQTYEISIDEYRKVWRKTSDLLDREQSTKDMAEQRASHYSRQPLAYIFPKDFSGRLSALNLHPGRVESSGIRAAIIREQGVNSDREMAYALYLAGFDVTDVHMTDLIEGRTDLSDQQMIVFVGGFSNSDVLGSARGWAGAFKFNKLARTALQNFYERSDTLSLGVCNGCQLMMELDLLGAPPAQHPKMHHNSSGKFECGFVTIDILPNQSVLFGGLAGSRLGIWAAHGEGRFNIPDASAIYQVAKYSFSELPGNPNGSDLDTAALMSPNGRHVAIMPHLERSLFPWNWPYRPGLSKWEVSPWMQAFTHAYQWLARE